MGFGGSWQFGVWVLGESGIGQVWVSGELSLVGFWDLESSGFQRGAVIWAPVFGFGELLGFWDRTEDVWDFGSEFGGVRGAGGRSGFGGALDLRCSGLGGLQAGRCSCYRRLQTGFGGVSGLE